MIGKGIATFFAFAAAMSASAQKDTTATLRDVVVTGTRNATDVRHLPMTISVIGRDRLTERHLTSALPTVMQQVPSFFVTGRSMMGYGVSTGAAGGINLRGVSGGAGQMLVLIDGHPQYNGVYGHPISDSYQTMMMERVEVLRGPASVLYGSNAMGGVMNIVTRGMAKEGSETNVSLGAGSYGTLKGEVSNQQKHGRFSSTVAAQYGRTDNHRPNMGFEQYGGYVKLGYYISEHWNAYLNADLTHFNSSYPGAVDSPIYGANQWITRGVASVAVENRYDRTSGAFSVYSNFGRHKIDDGSSDATNPTKRYFRSKDALTGVSWYQSAQLFTGNRLTVGVDYQHIYGNAYYTSKATGEVLDTPNKQSGKSYCNDIAGYVDFRQDLLSCLTFDAGIRLDHHNVTGSEWIPQVGVVYRPIVTGEVKLMASKGFRNPTMREMYLYPPSNEDLKPERLWNYELSWRQRLNGFKYGANIYYIKGDNMIQTVNRRNVNIGEIENWGAEVEASYRINAHWNVSTNHSFLHMEHPVVAAPEYKGYLGSTYTSDRWSVIAGLQYISGLYTEIGKNEQEENFTLLDVTVNYSILSQCTLWVSGENLLAQHYEINKGYPMPRATVMAGVDIKF